MFGVILCSGDTVGNDLDVGQVKAPCCFVRTFIRKSCSG